MTNWDACMTWTLKWGNKVNHHFSGLLRNLIIRSASIEKCLSCRRITIFELPSDSWCLWIRSLIRTKTTCLYLQLPTCGYRQEWNSARLSTYDKEVTEDCSLARLVLGASTKKSFKSLFLMRTTFCFTTQSSVGKAHKFHMWLIKSSGWDSN